MRDTPDDYFLFVGAADTESATTRLRAGGAIYRKKLLSSKAENWIEIAAMITSRHNRGTLVVLSVDSYQKICAPDYDEAASELLNALVGRPHVIFVHEEVFLTDEQRATAESAHFDRAHLADVTPRITEDDYFGMAKDEFFGSISNEVRQHVNTMLRDRELDVLPYRTNVERSIMASGFLEDHEHHLLFRLYVPSGRLYAHEAEALLGLFRDWLGQMGRRGVRQEGYSTTAGQVFEFFSADGRSEGGLARDFEDFSSFLDNCMSSPEVAASQLTATGLEEPAAARIVSRFATQARRLSLDLKQRREERILSLKHHFENVTLEIDGLRGEALIRVLEGLLPPPAAGAVVGHGASANASLTVNNYSPQFINQVAGPVIQNAAGTVNLGLEAKRLLELVATHGGDARGELETAVHELEDDGARGAERIAARSRLKRFLADLGNRGLGIGLDVLQKYVEHKVGIS